MKRWEEGVLGTLPIMACDMGRKPVMSCAGPGHPSRNRSLAQHRQRRALFLSQLT